VTQKRAKRILCTFADASHRVVFASHIHPIGCWNSKAKNHFVRFLLPEIAHYLHARIGRRNEIKR
jgi:hypothetical protein